MFYVEKQTEFGRWVVRNSMGMIVCGGIFYNGTEADGFCFILNNKS